MVQPTRGGVDLNYQLLYPCTPVVGGGGHTDDEETNVEVLRGDGLSGELDRFGYYTYISTSS